MCLFYTNAYVFISQNNVICFINKEGIIMIIIPQKDGMVWATDDHIDSDNELLQYIIPEITVLFCDLNWFDSLDA